MTNAINQGLGQGISQYQTNQLLSGMRNPGVNPMANFAGTGNEYAYGSGGYTGAGPYKPY
jgi:hypothetical protein